MSDTNAFDSLPPAPDDLWPKVSSGSPLAQSLASEVFPASLQHAAGILGRAVQSEMYNAGIFAAQAVMTPADMPLYQVHLRGAEMRFYSRLSTESAARLLHSYEKVHAQILRDGPSSLPTARQLKESATRTYRKSLRDETALQTEINTLKANQPGFNDELYSQLKHQGLGHGAKHHR